ncbi:MAG TPA: tetratricopeptide repeat protein, partial [bacterium]|nr:tetratricopeptide repeat protein [bacterium]
LAAVAGAAFRYAAMDHISPREFSYMIESCFRFRYAEMRMLGQEPPALDVAAQWPEGFPADRMILTPPDRLAALFYKLHRGDTYFAARSLINFLSAAGVAAFAALALAAFRRPWPAAAATLLYAGTFGAYSRSWGNFLREDFAMPGLLLAAAATLYLLTSPGGKRRWLVAGGAAAATLGASSCWHLSQFYVAVLALFVVGYAVAGRNREAALAGGGLWLGLAVAALLNKPLWVKGAFWNVSVALAAAPVLAWALGRLLGKPGKARWMTAAFALLLVALSLAFGRSAGYGHVYELVWAKLVHFGRYPGPAALSPDARFFWVGPYQSPAPMVVFFEYGSLILSAALGLGLWWYAVAKRRLAGGAFVAVAAPLFAVLYLLMMRLTVFLAPWVAILGIYPAAAIKGAKGRAAYGAVLALLWGFHVYTANVQDQPRWLQDAVTSVTRYEPDIPWYYGSERIELLLWLADRPRPAPVLADFSLSPPYLYLAKQPTALNPMFEVPEVRRKALTYAEAALADEETFYELCRRWRVKYVVHFAPQVLSRGAGTFYNATAQEPGPDSAAARMQFRPEGLRRFRLALETYNVRVFEVGKPFDGYASPAYHPLYDRSRFGGIPDEKTLAEFYRSRDRADYYYKLGCAYQAAGEFVAAAAVFNNTLRLHPDYEDANLRLGFCNLKLGLYDDARRALER